MDLLAQLAVNGIVAGSLYAALGVSFALIYGPTRIVHFAHGSVFAAGAYGAWAGMRLGLPAPLAAALGIACGGFLGLLCYLLAYRPLERRDGAPLILLITSLGLFIVLENAIGIAFGSDTKIVSGTDSGVIVVGPAVITVVQLAEATLSLGGIAIALILLRVGGLGRQIRAMTDNPDMARTIGIRTGRLSALVFLFGSMLCALPATVVPFGDGAQPEMGFVPSFIGYVVVMVGGVGSVSGAAVAGLLLGLVEHIGMWELPTEWQSTVAFVALVAILLIQPRGLFVRRG